jgi:uncharacterized membrane protein YesL
MSAESSTKEYMATSVQCALTVGALVALLYGLTHYHQVLINGIEFLALSIASGAVALSAFLIGLIKPLASQVVELPELVKWIVPAVFLWSLCVSHKLKGKGNDGGFSKIVKYTKRGSGALIIGILFAYCLNRDDPLVSFAAMAIALIYVFMSVCVFKLAVKFSEAHLKAVREAHRCAEDEPAQALKEQHNEC